MYIYKQLKTLTHAIACGGAHIFSSRVYMNAARNEEIVCYKHIKCFSFAS